MPVWIALSVVDAKDSSATLSAVGDVRPRRAARLRMPAAAFGLKENRGGALSSKICDNEHATAALGDSEPLRIQDSPRDVQRPCVGQGVKRRPEIPSPIATEGAGDVLPNSKPWA